MAQAGSPQGLRLPVSGRGQGLGIFSVGEAEASSRKSIPVGRSFPTRPSFYIHALLLVLNFVFFLALFWRSNLVFKRLWSCQL